MVARRVAHNESPSLQVAATGQQASPRAAARVEQLERRYASLRQDVRVKLDFLDENRAKGALNPTAKCPLVLTSLSLP